jgi:hypothetical protein
VTQPDPVITITDIRAAGHCARGARRWFEEHGIDFRRVVREGIPASELLATGDAIGIQVVERTLERRKALPPTLPSPDPSRSAATDRGVGEGKESRGGSRDRRVGASDDQTSGNS